jgi:hypothetical protein
MPWVFKKKIIFYNIKWIKGGFKVNVLNIYDMCNFLKKIDIN